MAIENQQPIMSKTQHYRKVTKPLLERKRRARMNHYLDELKELIIETMESNGEHVTKLEKADILELTVEYLKNKKEQQQQQQQTVVIGSKNEINIEKFRAGYTQAAYEVSKVFASVPGVNIKFGSKLMKHLAYQLKDIYPALSTDGKYIKIDSSSSTSSSSSSSSEQATLQQLKNKNPCNNYHYHHPYYLQHQQQYQLHKEQEHENLPSGNEVWRPW